MSRLTLVLARATTPEDLAEMLRAHALTELGAAGFTIYLLSREGATLELVGEAGNTSILKPSPDSVPAASKLPMAEVARSARSCWFGTLETLGECYPELAEQASQSGTRAWAIVPLLAGDTCMGSIGFTFDGSRRFEPLERLVLEAVASECALVLSNCVQRAEAAAARLETEAALHVQRRVLQSVAHELRTPLTSLWGYARMARRALEEPSSDPEVQRIRRFVGAVDRQASRLARLAALIGDAATIEGGKLVVSRTDFDLVPVLTRVVGSTNADIAHLQTVDLTAPETLCGHVDATRFEQLVQLLLDNATQFTPTGGHISVQLAAGEDDLILLEIRDSGPGVPRADRERAFAPFFQGKPASHTAGHTGLGLGLTVARAIVEAHDGSIKLDSPTDGSSGTRVLVALPARGPSDDVAVRDDAAD